MAGKRRPRAKKYYRFILRVNNELSPEAIQGIKRAMWTYMRDIPITDINSSKILKPHNIKFPEVVRC